MDIYILHSKITNHALVVGKQSNPSIRTHAARCSCATIVDSHTNDGISISIKNIQWFKIVDGQITIYCPFGTIKQVRLDEIKKAFKDNAVIFQLKMLGIRRPHIVLCLKKSVARKDISDAYNGSKKPYIIIPHSIEAEYLLLTEYKKICGEELIIKE